MKRAQGVFGTDGSGSNKKPKNSLVLLKANEIVGMSFWISWVLLLSRVEAKQNDIKTEDDFTFT